MAAPLYDSDGEITPLGSGLRTASLVVAVASGLALPYLTPVALLSPMICGGGCSDGMALLVTVFFLSPALLLLSLVSGIIAFRSPSWRAVLLTLVPSGIVTTIVVNDLL
ncbi:MAG TPA: hypothetical protein VF603_00420 [Allosphingosinicella sp.]|jgi:hypothetical protein